MARTRTDRFGRKTQSVAMKDRKGRGYPAGLVRIGGRLFKLELSTSKTDGVDAWVNVTELRGGAGGFGGGSYGGGYGGGRGRGGYDQQGGGF